MWTLSNKCGAQGCTVGCTGAHRGAFRFPQSPALGCCGVQTPPAILSLWHWPDPSAGGRTRSQACLGGMAAPPGSTNRCGGCTPAEKLPALAGALILASCPWYELACQSSHGVADRLDQPVCRPRLLCRRNPDMPALAGAPTPSHGYTTSSAGVPALTLIPEMAHLPCPTSRCGAGPLACLRFWHPPDRSGVRVFCELSTRVQRQSMWGLASHLQH